MTDNEQEKPRKKERLVTQAIKAYGLEERHVLAYTEADGGVTIVTTGGQKLTWRPGDAPEDIPMHILTGQALTGKRRGLTRGKK